MKKPRLLDIFCGSGGAGMGYHRAGFEVVGVDIKPQPHYPFEFHQADALEYPIYGFDVVHAGPPCQAYSKATAWRGSRFNHKRLISEIRLRIIKFFDNYVIENVEDARDRLYQPFMLCGSHFGLRIRRHRYFESPSLGAIEMPKCHHRKTDIPFDHGGKYTESEYRSAMQCDWMTVHEAREAIPPVYTEFIGKQLMAHLKTNANF
jgi:hypothetical protein